LLIKKISKIKLIIIPVGETKIYGCNWYVVLLREAHSIKDQEQRLVGSESG
jgi:hypothetical protein